MLSSPGRLTNQITSSSPPLLDRHNRPFSLEGSEMGFRQVFYTLREVFPQVDLRILKAVAGQYCSDVDAAVEFVLSDVLPAVSEPTEAHYTLHDIDCVKNDHENSCTNGAFPEKTPSLGYGRPLYDINLEGCSNIEDKVVVNETRITPAVYYDQVGAASVSATKPPILDYEQSALAAFVNHSATEKGNMSPHAEKLVNQKHLNSSCNLLDSLASSGSMLPLYDQSPSDCAVKCEGKMALKLPKAESTQDFSESDVVPVTSPLIVHDMDKYNEYMDITSQSYEISRINKLIADVTNSKEALSSLYELMRKKMNEVELQEENLRKAKQEATQAHQDFVTVVEKYNKLTEKLKESNDKQAEIVRGEKSLLTTLTQNLQSQLSKLSAERDDVLTVVQKTKFELDARLATSIEEETAARKNISQEEKLPLLVREAEMGSIMEESMKLQKEAEENILLRNVLTDCGHAIDILQGEISSIYEKVVGLKESTHSSKLQPALVTTNSTAISSDMPECKTPSPDRHWQLNNQDNSGILTQEKTPDSHAKDHQGLSDDEWEMLETTHA